MVETFEKVYRNRKSAVRNEVTIYLYWNMLNPIEFKMA